MPLNNFQTFLRRNAWLRTDKSYFQRRLKASWKDSPNFTLPAEDAKPGLIFSFHLSLTTLNLHTTACYPATAATYLWKVVLWQKVAFFPLKADVKRERERERELRPDRRVKTIEGAIFNLSLLCLEWKCRDSKRGEVISPRRRRQTSDIRLFWFRPGFNEARGLRKHS